MEKSLAINIILRSITQMDFLIVGINITLDTVIGPLFVNSVECFEYLMHLYTFVAISIIWNLRYKQEKESLFGGQYLRSLPSRWVDWGLIT